MRKPTMVHTFLIVTAALIFGLLLDGCAPQKKRKGEMKYPALPFNFAPAYFAFFRSSLSGTAAALLTDFLSMISTGVTALP